MNDPELVKTLTRLETKLDSFMSTQTDHETRIRDLERNDLGRIIPFLVGLIAIAAFGMQVYTQISDNAQKDKSLTYSVVEYR